MLPSFSHCFTGFRTVFVFALGPFLPMKVLFFPIWSFKGGKQAQKAKFLKLAQNPPKSDKRIKQTCSTPFWGNVGVKKWSRFFRLGAGSAIFCHLKPGTFGKSARFQVPKNGTSGADSKKPRPLFNANIPPKWCRARLFYAFSTFGWVLSQLQNFGFLAPFHPLKMTKSTSVPLGA